MPRPDPAVVRVLKEYRAMLDAKEAGLMADMATQWLTIEHKLDADISLLAREMADRAATGKVITEQMVWKAERYQIVKRQMEEEIGKYSSGYAAQTIATAQGQYALLGIDAAQHAIISQIGATGTYFTRINLGAVEQMIGLAGDGSPLSKLLKEAYPESLDGLMRELINGIARGLNPAQIAKNMVAGSSMGLERALLIARTEAARAYRFASAEQYRQSGVVHSFMRLVKRETACVGCLMLDGQKFDLESDLTDHPRGKCTAVPCVDGVSDPRWQTGPQWFNTLPADQQRDILGNERYQGLKDGQFSLSDLARFTRNDTWGDSPRPANLAELGLSP